MSFVIEIQLFHVFLMFAVSHQVQRFGHAASGHFVRAGGYPLLGERSEPLRAWEQQRIVSPMAHVMSPTTMSFAGCF